MNSRGFVPKVQMLEDVKIEFDDSTAKSKSKLPQTVNSKKKEKLGPSNNRYTKQN
jgi:hypothetical protein